MFRTLSARLAAGALLACVALAGGCESGGGHSGSGAAYESSATEAYDRGDYQRAASQATEEYRKTSGTRRDAAALTAGMAYHAMGNDTEAKRWLTPLTDSADRQIAARASAALGLIAADAGNHDKAVVLLTDAARVLPGDSGARAEFYAAESYAYMGRIDAARSHYRLASVKATDPALKRLINERLSTGGYTIQFGAFRTEDSARRAAADMRAKCSAAGAGDPRVEPRARPGAPTLYAVRAGAFASRAEADRVLLRTGLKGIVTLSSAN